MTKQHPRNRPSRKHVKPHKQKTLSPAEQQRKKKVVVLLIVAILVAIPFSLGKYFEFNSPGAFDSGAYVYSAKHILDGARINIDEKPTARVGTLLVNMLGVSLFGFNEIGPKLIQAILQAAAFVLMFISMRKLFGTLAAAVGLIVACVYLSAPLIAKYGNVKDQYATTFMIMAISCFVLRQLNGRWWWASLTGAFASLAPLFKPTGTTAIGAIALFVIIQPFFKHRTFKQTAADIALLVAGATVALAPIYIWLLIAGASRRYMPYWFVLKVLFPVEGASRAGSYVAKSREVIPFAIQWPRVLRYYHLLILPIAMALAALIARLCRMFYSAIGSLKGQKKVLYNRFVLLFGVWWILDMAFVWISPRSYDQYYLPLNASAAMLGGYLIALYSDKLNTSLYNRPRWIAAGAVGLVIMIIMAWPILFGIEKSPHSGTKYPEKRRGYLQKINEISKIRKENLKYPWVAIGEYIRDHSAPDDKIYVWGWIPGIYVKAQRFSPCPKAFEGGMHTSSPESLGNRVQEIVTSCRAEPPKFIVDTRKNHIPMDRPPFELWPINEKGAIDEGLMPQFDAIMTKRLSEEFEPAEAERYKAMLPLRRFVMNNYKIVRMFGPHVLFERK